MILAWLLLLTGLTISAVAIYYSVVGLAAIFSAAVIPIIVMGSALEVAKLVCASWLKANWSNAPRLLKAYMTIAVAVLMLITSMGIFGFLSKAHNDQNLVSGDVQSKIAIYDEKIKTAKENIEADRKQLKQMDEAVDQVMARSTSEEGATKANAIRKSQQRDRAALAKSIEANQKLIATLNDESAPIRAEIRKVEAEVGPLKYIAKFIYGDKTDENMLEKAVTWVIVLIVIVFDPLAVIMLLAAQMTFQWHNKGRDPLSEEEPLLHDTVPLYVADVGEPPTAEEKAEVEKSTVPYTFVDEHHEPDFPQQEPEKKPNGILLSDVLDQPQPQVSVAPEAEAWNKMIAEAEKAIEEERINQELARGEELLVQEEKVEHLSEATGDRIKPDFTEVIEPESKKKTYMTKDDQGKIQIKEVK